MAKERGVVCGVWRAAGAMGDRMAMTAAARRKVGADANGMELRVKGITDDAFRGYSARAAAALMRIIATTRLILQAGGPGLCLLCGYGSPEA